MPSLDDNRSYWGGEYHWSKGGDEWSEAWGGAADQWYASLYPRVRRFLPAGRIVEIAPGFGRWTQFLLDHCDHLIGVDLAERCVFACRERFVGVEKAEFYTNDGRTLDMVSSGSADFVFSMDSLVHAEADVMSGYLAALSDKLSPNGIAFLHHSNLAGEIIEPKIRFGTRLASSAPILERPLRKFRLVRPLNFRAASVSATLVEETCRLVQLRCIGQELISWNGPIVTDCFSVVTRPGSCWDRPNVVVANHRFWDEALSAGAAQQVYGSMMSDRV